MLFALGQLATPLALIRTLELLHNKVATHVTATAWLHRHALSVPCIHVTSPTLLSRQFVFDVP